MQRVEFSGALQVPSSGLITRKEFARFLGVEAGTVAQWAWRRKGPKPVRINGRAYYRYDDVRDFVSARRQG